MTDFITDDADDALDMFGAAPAKTEDADPAQELLQQRARAYARIFAGARKEDVEIVMDDLASFCRAFESTHHDDPRHSARLDGRREVYLRIMKHSRLPHDVLFQIYFRR